MIVLLRSRWVIIPLILFVILTGLWVLDGWLAEQRWNAYAAAARARGVKLTAEEMNPAPNPPIPDERNMAATPMWKAALVEDPHKDPRVPDYPFTQTWRRGAKRNGSPPVFDFAVLRAEMIAKEWLPKTDKEGSDAEAVLRGFQRLEPYLAELHESCTRPETHFTFDWSQGARIRFGNMSIGLKLVEILRCKMAALIVLRREAEAFALWKDGMRIVEAVRSTPSMITYLASLSISTSMLDFAWYGMCHDFWSDESLSEMAKVISKANPMASFNRALEGERALLNTSIVLYNEDRHAFNQLLGIARRGKYKWLDWIQIRRPSWLRENQIRFNEIYEEQMTMFDERKEIGVPDPKLVASIAAIEANPRPNEELVALYLSSLSSFRDKALFEHALVRMAEIACALERYKRAKATYPEKQEELLPGWMARLPHDPCTGSPFIYRRDPSTGFLLYSVGLNATDDWGVASGDVRNDPDWRWFAPVKP